MNFTGRFVAAVIFIFLPAFSVRTGEPLKRSARPTLAIEKVTIVDVVRGKVTSPRTIVIREGRIAAIDEPDMARVPGDAIKVNGKGRFLIPGLVDMHVHLFNNASHRPANDWAFPLFVANGVTGVREMRTDLTDLPMLERWRAGLESGELVAPRVLAAGVAVRGDSSDSARRLTREAHERGVAFIKIFSEVPESHWRAILDEARTLRMPVCGHVPATVSAVAAATAGQRSNEHLTQLYEACSTKEKEFLAARRDRDGTEAVQQRDAQEAEVLETFDARICHDIAAALASTGQVQVPTLVLPHFEGSGNRKQFRDDPRWLLLRADEQARWTRIMEQENAGDAKLAFRRWEVSRAIVSALHERGVPILTGTDTPMPLVYPGSSLHKELELLVESGLSPADALRAATIGPAEFLGVNDSYGSVAISKRADLVLLDDNPLREITNLQRIRAVVLDGRLFERADLDALLAPKSR